MIFQVKRSVPIARVKEQEKAIWYLDSGCSRHMTGVKSFLTSFQEQVGPPVIFGDNAKGNTKGYGTLQLGNVKIERVSFVQGLKHNLLSISQICDKGYIVEFVANKVFIKHGSTKQIAFSGTRQGNMYVAEWTSSHKEV